MFENRRTTQRSLEKSVVCSDPTVHRIVDRLQEEQYWKRFKHSITSDVGERRTRRKKKVSLAPVSFLEFAEI